MHCVGLTADHYQTKNLPLRGIRCDFGTVKVRVSNVSETVTKSLISSFCLRANIEDLCRVDATHGDVITCLPGIRVISMALIMAFHTYYYTSGHVGAKRRFLVQQ